jgi:hypothetical protein
MEIRTFRYELRWSLGIGVHMIGPTAVAAAYWIVARLQHHFLFRDGNLCCRSK